MREIKFRAWDKGTKKWLLGYEYPNLGGFSLFGECMLMGEWGHILNNYILNYESHNHNEGDLVVMQFTGLHDKNGVDIYEGDIVNCYDHPTDMESGIFEIGFHSGTFVCKGSAILLRDFGTAWTKVVGNKFETPDLL